MRNWSKKKLANIYRYTTVVDPTKADQELDLRHPDDRQPPTDMELEQFAAGLMQV